MITGARKLGRGPLMAPFGSSRQPRGRYRDRGSEDGKLHRHFRETTFQHQPFSRSDYEVWH